ncbi:MAG TPA: DNA replication/repair protein RecF [Xanthobacteraceae bacterium]|nr:DNA replication/repair protein RecF [Xanthobacteraceae bacterium]
MTNAARICRLILTNFRSYRTATVAPKASLVALTGPNGAGKTNLLESISFLSPGRGLRRAQLDEIAFSDSNGDNGHHLARAYHRSWAVSAEVDGALGLATLGTGIEPGMSAETALSRKCRIDREPVASAAAFADHLRVVWLIPSMDSLFLGPASERRRFLDRLVLAVDAAHASRISALEHALRSRNRLLENRVADSHWLDAAEHETAEIAVAVAAARAETMRRLAAALAVRRETRFGFPSAETALDGWMETMVLTHPATEVEDRYRAMLKENRARDAAAGRTLEGPHLTDLVVHYREKAIAASSASTGEQKALLIGLVLAHAALVGNMTGTAPVILLDEVVAHLDPDRRAALFEALDRLGSQVWMTGADPMAFADIASRADVVDVRTLSVG